MLAKYNGGVENAMGPKGTVDPIRHLIVTAAGWGANPDKDASYAGVDPKSDGKTIYKLNIPAEVSVDGFWSITVYNAKGYFEKNPYDAYSVNNITAAAGRGAQEFALNEDRPLFAFAGIWTTFNGNRGTKSAWLVVML